MACKNGEAWGLGAAVEINLRHYLQGVVLTGSYEVDLPKGGLTDPAVLLSFSGLFDFPQYSDTLRHRTIHTVRTNRIIL